MTGRCADCDALTTSLRCGPCWKAYRADKPPVSGPGLPPRDPDPPSIPFCRCGAIRNVVAFAGQLRCADCWRRGAA